jgi:hypothetical protein
MAEHLQWLLGPARRLAFFGDDDGGRLFHPQGKRDEFGRATLSTCGLLLKPEDWVGTREELAEQAAWWLGVGALSHARSSADLPQGSKLFPDAGAVFLQSQNLYLQFDAGPFGYGGAGHSHADTLSFVLWHDNELVFTDPGTFTYIGSPTERDRFRGTPAHNTITINGQNQAQTAGPFRWNEKPEVQLLAFTPTEDGGVIDATCTYRNFQHRRRLRLQSDQLTVLDEITGPPGEHSVQQTWNLGPAADQVHLSFSDHAAEASSEFSPAYGVKNPARSLVVQRSGPCPIALAMCLNTQQKVNVNVAETRQMFDNEVSNFHP